MSTLLLLVTGATHCPTPVIATNLHYIVKIQYQLLCSVILACTCAIEQNLKVGLAPVLIMSLHRRLKTGAMATVSEFYKLHTCK